MTLDELLAMPERERNLLCARDVMGWQVADAVPAAYRLPLYIDGDVTRTAQPFAWQEWIPHLDANADYSVLCHVRATWCNVAEANRPENSHYRLLRSRFFAALRQIWARREKDRNDDYAGWVNWFGRYEPGDYRDSSLLVALSE